MADERCFAFVDLAGYTAMTEAHGDEGAADIAARFYAIARAATDDDTRIVKRIGDAVMLVGSDVQRCMRVVLRIFEEGHAQQDFLALRAGLYAGPAVERDDDFFGAAVNLAARIAAHARSGEILCGSSVAQEAERCADVRVERIGVVTLKNVKEQVELFAIVSATAAPATDAIVIDPVCRMRVPSTARREIHEGCAYCFCSEECAKQFRRSPGDYVR